MKMKTEFAKMLTRNDKCFFALSFYRQTIAEFIGCKNENKQQQLFNQATYWWNEYLNRRAENRLQKHTVEHKKRLQWFAFST